MKKFEVNKITPLHDLSWYIKWISSIILLVGMLLTSMDITPYNLYLHLIGVCGWFFVGMMWHDRALIVLNTILISMLSLSLFRYFVI